MGRLQLLEVGSDTSEAKWVGSIPCFVCISLMFDPGSVETLDWGRMVRVKQMTLPGRTTKMVGIVE